MSTTTKEAARQLIETLSDDSTWDEVLRLINERRFLEESIADLDAGRRVSNSELRTRLGLAP